MEEWILDRLLSQIIKWVPNPDTVYFGAAYKNPLVKSPIAGPIIPPSLCRKLFARWQNFETYYVDKCAGQFLSIPGGTPIVSATLSAWLQLTSQLDVISDSLSVSTDFPLPKITFHNRAVFDNAAAEFLISLDHEFDTYPQTTTLEFDYCYWLIIYGVRTMLLSYYIEQELTLLRPLQ